ncbi:DUF4232 domain-containing protein [Streptomyces sp. NPDC002138]|uniref:DUF4232 domain-containing protein n=1 Tax=Streptomyces sp. NPDC002138 TaxID=3154410 RepID=UPI003322A731
MHAHRLRSAALAATVTAGLALALTACGGSGGGTGAVDTGAGKEADKAASTGAAGGASAAGAQGAPADGKSGGSAPATPATAGGPAAKGAGDTTGDAYAYTHPCPARSLTVKVTSPQGAPAGVRVVTVTNNGATSCGLDFHPAIGFSAKGAALGVQATAPGGLGGAPAHPVRPGATAYAAVRLAPAGGTGPVADEISVLADATHMANADGVSLPLAEPGTVAQPEVGLYRGSARDAMGAL